MKILLAIIISITITSCNDGLEHINKLKTSRNACCQGNLTLGSNEKNMRFGCRDIDEAIICAKLQKKNILVIFSGWSVSSRLEWKVLDLFNDYDFITDNFIVAWLPCDDKTLLLDTTRVWNKNNLASIALKTRGDSNSVLQIELLKENSIPMFCFVDTNRLIYGNRMGYTMQKKVVQEFMLSGVKR